VKPKIIFAKNTAKSLYRCSTFLIFLIASKRRAVIYSKQKMMKYEVDSLQKSCSHDFHSRFDLQSSRKGGQMSTIRKLFSRVGRLLVQGMGNTLFVCADYLFMAIQLYAY